MSFCSSTMESFPFVFDPEAFEKKIPMFHPASDDLFSTFHQNIPKIFTENNLDTLAPTTDFGIHDFTKIPNKGYMSLTDDQTASFDLDTAPGTAIKPNLRASRSFTPSFGYSPLRFPQTDINPANFMAGPVKGNFSKQLGFPNMPLDFTPTRMFPKFQEDGYLQFEAMENLTMRDFPSLHDYDAFAEDPLSLTWNSNAAALKDLKSIRSTQGHLYGLNMDNIPMDMTTGSSMDSTGAMYAKNEAVMDGNMGLGQGNVMKKGELMAKKMATEKVGNEMQGKMPGMSVRVKEGSQLQRKSSKLSDDDDDNDFDGDGKGRSSKGLRVLSLKVKDIVIEKKKTTYKEVASILIKELGGQVKTKSQGETKDEQNVKRRVYDALNVLIATGVLQKEGKLVSFVENGAQLPVYSKREIRDKKDHMEHKITEIKKMKKAKLEALHELLYKTLALKNLIKRNKEKTEKESNKSAPASGNDGDKGSIKFPFLVIASSAGESSMNLNMNALQKELVIESKHALSVSGDVDLLLKMELHNVSREFFDENIPQGLQKHMPKAFLEQLQ